jgi:hypothetical protein
MTQSEGSAEFKLIGELGSWEVSLVGGLVMRLAAHAYSRQEGEYVFVALAEGTPPIEIELARIPITLVAKIRGG